MDERQKTKDTIVSLPSKEEMEKYMQEAIAEARQGLAEGGIPIGSVLVKDNVIVGRGHNRRMQNGDPTAHAEIDCLKNAGRLGDYRKTILYSTLMPCAMCAGASVQFKVPIVIAGENRTFQSARTFMESNGIKVIDLDLDECFEMLKAFAEEHPHIWDEDIGVTRK